MPNNLAPEFVESLKTYQELDFSPENRGKQDFYFMGQLVDYEGDPFSVKFSGTQNDFLKPELLADGTIFIDIDYNASSSKAKNGNYTLELAVVETLDDGTTSIKNHQITFEVTGMSEENAQTVDVDTEFVYDVDLEEKGEVVVDESLRPTLSIDSIDKFGRVKVLFDQNLIVPHNLTYVNDTVIDLNMTALNDEQQGLMEFQWSVAEFTQ